MKKIAIVLIKAYSRLVSPLAGQNCRFYPSCSQYAITAISKYGFLKGALKAISRIVRCSPFNPGGYDPVV